MNDSATLRRAFFLLLAIAWMGLIFYLSAQPNLSIPGKFWGRDKVMHALFFGVLAVFITLAMLEDKRTTAPWKILIAAVGVVAVYGLIDEIHQSSVPGRHMSWADWVADVTGGIVATLLILRLRRVHKPLPVPATNKPSKTYSSP